MLIHMDDNGHLLQQLYFPARFHRLISLPTVKSFPSLIIIKEGMAMLQAMLP